VFNMIRLLSVIFLLYVSLAAKGSLIYLKSSSVYHHDLNFSQIAWLSGTPLSDDLLQFDLLKIARSNGFLLKEDLTSWLSNSFPELSYKILGVDTVYLQQHDFLVDGRKQEELLRNYLGQSLTYADSLIVLNFRNVPESFYLPDSPDSMIVHCIGKIKLNNFNRVILTAWINGSEYSHYEYRVRVRAYDYYLTVNRLIAAREAVADSALAMGKFFILNSHRTPLKDPGKLRDARARRTLKPGDMLFESFFDFPILVDKGQMVAVKYQQGNVKMMLQCEALQKGRRGDRINVRNPQSHKIISVILNDYAKGVVE